MENQKENPMTEEELLERKKEMLEFYQESMPYLKAQFEYEEMLFKLDEVRFKRTGLQIQFAMMMQQQNEHSEMEDKNDSEENVQPNTSRKLKK